MFNSGNPQISLIPHQGTVTLLCIHNFQALPSSTTLPQSTWLQAHNTAPVQPKDIWVVAWRGRDTISPKQVMVDIKCYSLSNSQDKGRHLLVYSKLLQQHLWTILSFGRLPTPLLDWYTSLTHLGDPQYATQQNDSS